MKVLIIGGGGREHAIAVSMKKSRRVDKLYCVPGNAGIAEIAECEPSIGVMEFDKIVAYAKEKQVEVFEDMIDIACKLNKPIVIHSRNAAEETLQVLNNALKKYDNLKGIFHCFDGSALNLLSLKTNVILTELERYSMLA